MPGHVQTVQIMKTSGHDTVRDRCPLLRPRRPPVPAGSHPMAGAGHGRRLDPGVPVDWLRELCAYWENGYDWRRLERRLNAEDQLTTEIEGLTIHCVHRRSPEPDALPLVLTHGWPGSVVEFLDVIGPLADPVAHGGQASDAFHVVCPSLPGFGFSGKPTDPGWGPPRVARA